VGRNFDSKSGNREPDDLDMRPEYDFSGGVRGKYAARFSRECTPPIHSPREVTATSETPIRAVDMVRVIRDEIYEETKDLSREELKAFYQRESDALRRERPSEVISGRLPSKRAK
jgi:hypothetical protein